MIRCLVFSLLCSIGCMSYAAYGSNVTDVSSDRVTPDDLDGYFRYGTIINGSEQKVCDILNANPDASMKLQELYADLFLGSGSFYRRVCEPFSLNMYFVHKCSITVCDDARAESVECVREYNEIIDNLGLREYMVDEIENCIERSLIKDGHEEDVRTILRKNLLDARWLRKLYMMSKRYNEGSSVWTDAKIATESRYNEVIRQIGLDAHLNGVWD